MKQLAIYGISGGLLIASLQFMEYRFTIVERSVPTYAALVAGVFAAVGLVLGFRFRKKEVVIREVPVEVRVPASASFEPDTTRIEALGITPREMEVLTLIAEGLSTKEMAERLFVSENTVKTHTSRVMEKLGASRRTQAVQIAKSQRIIA